MTLPIPANTQAKLAAATDEGLDLVYVVRVGYQFPVGNRWYSTRLVPGIPSIPFEDKLIGITRVPKRVDPSSIRSEALNDDLVIRIVNTPEYKDGTTINYDLVQAGFQYGRAQDLMTQAPLLGGEVWVGMFDIRNAINFLDIKWDGVYRIDRIDRDNEVLELYCVDRMLHPGEVVIGETINNSDFPLAPIESYGQVRGPVFGKVDGLPLVPVEVGLQATLASEIDDQDGVIDVTGGDLSQWPAQGFVEIADEIIFYGTINRTTGRLGTAQSPCLRGAGFPFTTVSAHNSGTVLREVYTGRADVLAGNHSTAATTITIQGAGYPLPSSGVIVIGSEAIGYAQRTGNVLSGLTRGRPVPTLARVHNMGSTVRTIPTGPDGKPRYRYVVGDGKITAVSNLRMYDANNNALPYTGGAHALNTVTVEGRAWTLCDLPARPRFERYQDSGTQVPQEWIYETDGTVDADGVALPTSFLRWFAGGGMSPAFANQWPLAIDPAASTRAVIMSAAPGQNVFSVRYQAGWDGGLNAPRMKFGRFRNARLRMRVQYDRQTNTRASYQISTSGELVKTGQFIPPTLGGGSGDGTVSGSQKLPESRWQTQTQTKEVRLSSRTTGAYADGLNGHWVDPVKVWETSGGVLMGGRADHSAATDGDTRSFLSGRWNFTSGLPQLTTSTGVEPLYLYSNDTFPDAGSGDKLLNLVVTIHNPVGYSSANAWTGWSGFINLYEGTEYSGAVRSFAVGIGRTEARKTVKIPLTGMTWRNLQSIRLMVESSMVIGDGTRRGATVGNISMAVEYQPDVEGQRIGTIVDGSYFRTTASTSPSAVYDQVVSLGAVVKDWAARNNRDPWDFFGPQIGGNGMQVMVSLPTAGDGLQFAMADIFLELEYDVLEIVYDGQLVADVDGRSGVPVTGGASRVLENPVDVLAHIIEDTDFYGMVGMLDAEWAAVRPIIEQIGWRVARAVVQPIQLRELMSSLCMESRLAVLAEAQYVTLRMRFEEADPQQSIRTVGDQVNPSFSLVRDKVPIVNRLQDVFNSLGCYYRRNYLTGDFRAVIEETDEDSANRYGKRRHTPNLDWHQSARGYAGGFDEQKTRLRWLTKYLIDTAARMWDYATIELHAAAAEDLQNYDVITVNYPRSGYYSTPGRVVAIERLEGPMRWQVTLQMNRSTQGYIWQSATNPDTYIKLAEAATRMDYIINGVLVGQITAAGHFRCRGNFTVSGTAQIDASRIDGGSTAIYVYRERHGDAEDGQYERIMEFDQYGNVTLRAYSNGGAATVRDAAAPGTLLNIGGVAGIVDTGDALAGTGRLEFYLANRKLITIDNNGMVMLGRLIANLGTRIGSIQT